MRSFRFLAAALCAALLSLTPASGQQKSPEIRTCKLRLAWWSPPENPPELALQMDKARTSFSPDIMALSQVIDYRGEPNAVILRKTLSPEVDKSGKPIVLWVPYCTIPVAASATDLAVLLFPDEKNGVATTRVFDFSTEAFPYGSVQLVNFTTSKIAISIDGTTFVANSRGTARYPKTFSKVTVARFYMAAAETNGEKRMLRSTTMIFKPTARMLLFALEVPGAGEDARYHTQLIIDNEGSRPTVVEPDAPAPKGKGKGPGNGGKKGKDTPPTPEPSI